MVEIGNIRFGGDPVPPALALDWRVCGLLDSPLKAGNDKRGDCALAFCKNYHIRVGRYNAMIGNAIKIASRTRSVTMNGNTPLKIVAKLTSLTTLLMTKTFIPTGGWMSPSSTVITMMTPNQIGSKPSVLMTGKMIGTVRMIIAIASIRQPSTRYINMISASTP